jgi:hypothetical protein
MNIMTRGTAGVVACLSSRLAGIKTQTGYLWCRGVIGMRGQLFTGMGSWFDSFMHRYMALRSSWSGRRIVDPEIASSSLARAA